MGNQLAGMAPTAIHPIDYYLSDVGEFQLVNSLGQTRFLKVAKCKHYEGECVVKILSVEDPSLPLATHKARIEKLSRETVKNVSIAGFHRVSIYTNFALMARQYVRFSLYDRLSTRPFLSQLEKCWIAYQILRCLEWSHSRGITHGDLKLENILVTSSLWVVITDFATYKPLYLPDDNPSDFNYFFDTSRRRCCNIAPERFISEYSSSQPAELMPQSSSTFHTSLPTPEPSVKPVMDMFSVGCVLAELFSDDAPNGNLFDLGNLLAYRARQYFPEKAINSIINEDMRELVKNLINLEPNLRDSASQALLKLTPKVFPQYFNTLYDYFRQLVRLPPDAKVIRLSQELDLLLTPILEQEPNGLLLLLLWFTSTMRGLKHSHCKIIAQRLSCKIVSSSSVTSTFVTDRLLPYLLNSLTDSDSKVRSEAIQSITHSLEQVETLPQSDNNVFTDYILPVMCQISMDRSVFVRLTLASNVSRLAKIAHTFLSHSCDQNYDEELSLLHEAFQLIVSNLLTDSENNVRRTLLVNPESCANLCVFFGRQKTNDVLLSHIITFLNDKTDFQLRVSFFNNIIVIASFLGSQCSQILQPLLQQGLSDPEETIIYKTIDSLSSLIEQGLLNKNIIYELVRDAMPLLAHPNLWIRHSLINLTLTLTSKLSLADINCKIKPLVDPHLKRKIQSFTDSKLLFDSLYEPIPRTIYDLVVNSKLSVESLFECLNQRNVLKTMRHQSLALVEDALYTRLTHEALNEQIEEQLLRLSDFLKKVHRNKKNLNVNVKKVSGDINITKTNRRIFSVSLIDDVNSMSDQPSSYNKKLTSTTQNMNEEWLHMFGSSPKLMPAGDDIESSGVIPVAHEAREYDVEGESMLLHVQCPPCNVEIHNLVQHKKNNYSPPLIARVSLMSPFRPRGVLVAHLHEHDSTVNRLLNIDDSSLFATCSSDGSIKIWDSSRMEGKASTNRSKQTFVIAHSTTESHPIGGITYCKEAIIAFTANTNLIHVLEIDSQSTCMRLITSFEVTFEVANTSITDISTVTPNVFAISCSDSSVMGFDLRQVRSALNSSMIRPIWKLTLRPHERLVTSITSNDVVLFAGTSHGLIVTFDLRFLVRSNSMSYPGSKPGRIRRLSYSADHGLYSAAQGNCEVSLWNCESGSRMKNLWASSAPALTLTQVSLHSILGLLQINTGKETSMITCGTDMRIRYWDLNQPERSYIISDSGKGSSGNAMSHSNVKYSAKFIEGIQVIQECQHDANNMAASLHQQQAVATSSQSSNHSVGWDQQGVSTCHRDSITDITRINHLLISASKDGVVKVWK